PFPTRRSSDLMSRLHRFADARDRVAGLAACPADRRLNLPHGLVDLTLGLQLVIAGQRADPLLDPALRLVALPCALVLVPHLKPPHIVPWRSICGTRTSA